MVDKSENRQNFFEEFSASGEGGEGIKEAVRHLFLIVKTIERGTLY